MVEVNGHAASVAEFVRNSGTALAEAREHMDRSAGYVKLAQLERTAAGDSLKDIDFQPLFDSMVRNAMLSSGGCTEEVLSDILVEVSVRYIGETFVVMVYLKQGVNPNPVADDLRGAFGVICTDDSKGLGESSVEVRVPVPNLLAILERGGLPAVCVVEDAGSDFPNPNEAGGALSDAQIAGTSAEVAAAMEAEEVAAE